MITKEHANFPRAGFLRRLGAMLYDALLAVAVYTFFGAIGVGIFTLMVHSGLISFGEHQHIADLLNGTPLYHGIYQVYLFVCVAFFYAIFWHKGGQTLGMRAWRLKVQHPNGQTLGMITSLARVFWSALGASNLFILFSADKLALQDKMTQSEVVVLSKEANQMRNWHGT